MIAGIGTDLCPASRWKHLVERFGEKPIHRVLAPEEAAYLLSGHPQRLAERLAGRWALREAFGKAMGVGMDGWNWRELRFQDGRLWAEGGLVEILARRGIQKIHGSVSHDGGTALAFVILEAQSHP